MELFIVQKIVKIIALGLGLGWAESERLGRSNPAFFTNLVPDDQPLERMVMVMVLMMMMVMMATKLWTLILTSAILIRARKASTSSRLWNSKSKDLIFVIRAPGRVILDLRAGRTGLVIIYNHMDIRSTCWWQVSALFSTMSRSANRITSRFGLG